MLISCPVRLSAWREVLLPSHNLHDYLFCPDGLAKAPFVVQLDHAGTCGGSKVLTLNDCIMAAHYLQPGAKLHKEQGADYTSQWPKGCFLRDDGQDSFKFFFNAGGTTSTPTKQNARRICQGIAESKPECQEGEFSDTLGASACKKCPAGKNAQYKNTRQCTYCKAGQYQVLAQRHSAHMLEHPQKRVYACI